MTINERIKELRKSHGLTQEEFGKRIGLKKSAASWIEQDGNTIIDQNIRLICNAFHINEEWLRTGEGQKELGTRETFIREMVDRFQGDGLDVAFINAWLDLSDRQKEGFIALCDAVAKNVAPEDMRRVLAYQGLDILLDMEQKKASSTSESTDSSAFTGRRTAEKKA